MSDFLGGRGTVSSQGENTNCLPWNDRINATLEFLGSGMRIDARDTVVPRQHRAQQPQQRDIPGCPQTGRRTPPAPPGNTLRASLAIPLKVSGEVWGLLAVGDKATGSNYSLGELRALRRLARELALGIYRAYMVFGRSDDEAARPGIRLSSLFPKALTSIGPYHVERLLGEGGMALVYLGRHDDQQVAIKVLNDRAQEDSKTTRRFQRECEILRQLPSSQCP